MVVGTSKRFAVIHYDMALKTSSHFFPKLRIIHSGGFDANYV